MGNRANIIFHEDGRISPCVYLHWNGGADSVYAFLAELDRRGVRADAEYDAARFVQIVGEFMDSSGYRSTTSLGILNGPKAITPANLKKLPTDNSNNGFYVVTRAGALSKVRRFTCQYPDSEDYSSYRIKEWTAQEVAAEKIAALDTDKYRDIVSMLAKLEPTKTEAEHFRDPVGISIIR